MRPADRLTFAERRNMLAEKDAPEPIPEGTTRCPHCVDGTNWPREGICSYCKGSNRVPYVEAVAVPIQLAYPVVACSRCGCPVVTARAHYVDPSGPPVCGACAAAERDQRLALSTHPQVRRADRALALAVGIAVTLVAATAIALHIYYTLRR